MIAFLDACVLYPAVLRDILLTLSEGGLYQIRWSPDVLNEMERNLIKRGRSDGRLRGIMESAFPDAMVPQEDYSSLIDEMPNDPKDRHVLAAAIACEADVLVTANIRHFRPLPSDCTTVIQHPDDFLLEQLDDSSRELFDVLKRMADDRHHPMDTVPGILSALHKTAPNFGMRAFDLKDKYLT